MLIVTRADFKTLSRIRLREALDEPRHLSDGVVNNILIDDAYVYRLDTAEARIQAKKASIPGIVADHVARMSGVTLEGGKWRTLRRSGNHQFEFKLNGQRKYIEFSDEFMSDADSHSRSEEIAQALEAFLDGRANRALVGHTVFRLSD